MFLIKIVLYMYCSIHCYLVLLIQFLGTVATSTVGENTSAAEETADKEITSAAEESAATAEEVIPVPNACTLDVLPTDDASVKIGYTCSLCKKVLASAKNLTNHLKKVHKQDPTVQVIPILLICAMDVLIYCL